VSIKFKVSAGKRQGIAFLILLYGLEVCPMRKSDLTSLDFVVNRFVMKLFQTVLYLANRISFLICLFPSALLKNPAEKFDIKHFKNNSNLL